MPSNAIYTQFNSIEPDWYAGHKVDAEGFFLKEEGFLAFFDRLFRLVYRNLNPFSSENLDAVIREQLAHLVDDLSKMSPQNQKQFFARTQSVHLETEQSSLKDMAKKVQKLLRQHKAALLDASPTRSKAIEQLQTAIAHQRAFFKQKSLVTLPTGEKAFRREKQGIETIIQDPKSCFNQFKLCRCKYGNMNLTNSFMRDFARSTFYINGEKKYEHVDTPLTMVEELVEQGAKLKDIEKVLRFTSQGNVLQLALWVNSITRFDQNETYINHYLKYYLDVDALGNIHLTTRIVFDIMGSNKKILRAVQGEISFDFDHASKGTLDYDRGMLIHKLHEI